MTIEQSLVTYTIAASIVTITPGVDTALVLRASTSEGARSAAAAGIGVAGGLILWGGMVALGLGEVLAASQVAYTILKWAGAGYLCYLGIKLLLKKPKAADLELAEDLSAVRGKTASWLAKGFFSNLLNPKIGVFYVTFLPQFVPTGGNVSAWMFLFGLMHAVLVAIWFGVIIAASVPLGRALRSPRVVKVLDRTAGVVFLAFGARLALSKR